MVDNRVKDNKTTDGHKINPKKKVKNKRFVLKKFELFANIGGYKAGAVIPLRCHKKTGIPMDRYWRNRLRDAEVDGCIKIVKVSKPKDKDE